MTRITILIEEPKWRRARGLAKRLRAAAALALKRGGTGRAKASLTILLASDDRLRALNAAFRGKNKATNVLSFPASAGADGYCGDVALAYGVTEAEARENAKRLGDHATHLVVHGVLHLLGHDHETDRDARLMEPLERKILAELGIADPYTRRAKAA